MQRYTPYVDYENLYDDEGDITVIPNASGAWVLHSDAQAEIARLQAALLDAVVVIRGLMIDSDTAWNDAIEAAYSAAEQYPPDDMTTAERDAFIHGCMAARDAIRALRKDQA